VRFDDRVTSGLGHRFATKARIIHIDIDPAEIGKVVRADIPIVGNAKLVLEELLPKVTKPEISPWWQQIRKWQEEKVYSIGTKLSPQVIVEALGEVAGKDAIITTDVGQHQMWAAQIYPAHYPRHFITSGGLGTMGFGLPAAIGAKIAAPDKEVFLVTGDGSLQMCIQELATAVQYKLPVKIILMNNGVLGMVRQLQMFMCEERYNQIQLVANPDFVKIAEAYGILGIRVTEIDQVHSALQEAINHPGPVLIDFVISEEEVVYPMVLPGKALSDMLGR